MHLIDWVLVVAPMALVLWFAIYTRRYVRSVADFLAGGRCAGRYLLANARGESDSGLANTMSKFEIILVSGFVLSFWDKITVPIVLLVFISGFVFYRFRETRALTMAQFFEMRYSRRFRLFMGGLAFVSGILNYGVFPAISARFFVYFLDLPTHVYMGALAIPTYALIMLAYLACTVFMVVVGGQVTLMVTDCIEGLLSHVIYIAVVAAVLMIVHWNQIVEVTSATAPGHSLINPFDAIDVKDFNVWFAAMSLVIYIYNTIALQNKQGFNAAARTPHEARMAGVLGQWRMFARMVMILVVGVCALTFLRHPAFADRTVPVQAAIHAIPDAYLQKQMTIPIALRYLLPTGIKGLFCAMMVMGMISGDSGHMHSWGSIFIQDVILPLRRRPLSPRAHMWALRLAVIFVATFAFFFSLLFHQTQYIAMWWSITGGVFICGAGAVIIGGLYWRRGTTAGAWTAVIVGAALCLLGIAVDQKWSWFVEHGARWGVTLPKKFWLNYMQSTFGTLLIAGGAYMVVSWLTCREMFNLDRLLHRGEYADDPASAHKAVSRRSWFSLSRALGITSDFSFWDKVVSAGVFWWSMLLLGVNLAVAAWNLSPGHGWPVSWWAHYWFITAIALPLVVAFVTLVWFGIGGIIDIRDFFAALRTMKRDVRDDGRVSDVPIPLEKPQPASAPTAAAAQPGGETEKLTV